MKKEEIDLEEMFEQETGNEWAFTRPDVYTDWLEKKLKDELVKNCSIPDVVGQSEQFFLFYKELQKAGRLYNDNLSDDIMKREAEWFVKKK